MSISIISVTLEELLDENNHFRFFYSSWVIFVECWKDFIECFIWEFVSAAQVSESIFNELFGLIFVEVTTSIYVVSVPNLINNALNSTLSRTAVTGLTTIGVLIILFVFGGEVIRGFAFAMLLGVIVGTYTSLFVASPIVVDLTRRTASKSVEEKK